MAFGKKPPPLDPVALAQAQQAREQAEVSEAFRKGITALRDFIAPSSIEFFSTYFQIGTRLARTYYVYGYPRQIYTGWLSGLVHATALARVRVALKAARLAGELIGRPATSGHQHGLAFVVGLGHGVGFFGRGCHRSSFQNGQGRTSSSMTIQPQG